MSKRRVLNHDQMASIIDALHTVPEKNWISMKDDMWDLVTTVHDMEQRAERYEAALRTLVGSVDVMVARNGRIFGYDDFAGLYGCNYCGHGARELAEMVHGPNCVITTVEQARAALPKQEEAKDE